MNAIIHFSSLLLEPMNIKYYSSIICIYGFVDQKKRKKIEKKEYLINILTWTIISDPALILR